MIQACTTREKCEAALVEHGFPTRTPSGRTRPECPEDQVCGKHLNIFFFSGTVRDVNVRLLQLRSNNLM